MLQPLRRLAGPISFAVPLAPIITPPLALTPGTRLGVYEITAPIGEGGMGQVYRATDTTLGRQVAIKILPDAFASDPERLARFEREAKTLASLNHPHIAAIYGFEKSAGMHALVMELVEGEDLSQRIARGAIPIDEALPIAKQIAEALEAAHEQGIIHRDLKPANIKVRADGTVKVLDFGLAKAHRAEPARSTPSVSQSPTITSPAMMTGVGMILGTAAYMSPEQARGKPVDRRADIWAFGCVFYEMLTGRRAFGGDELTDVLARVLEREPDFTALPAKLPATIRMTLRRCLQKDSRQRLQHIGDARLDIADAQHVSPDAVIGESWRGMGRERIAWALLAVVAATAAGAAVSWGVAPAPDAPEMRLDITTPETATLASFAISPDGLDCRVQRRGASRATVVDPTAGFHLSPPTAGTEGGHYPFWSPNGRSVGFFANGKLKRTTFDGGQPQSLADVLTPAGGTWNADGTILVRASQQGKYVSCFRNRPRQQRIGTAPHPAAGDYASAVPSERSAVSLLRCSGRRERRRLYRRSRERRRPSSPFRRHACVIWHGAPVVRARPDAVCATVRSADHGADWSSGSCR